MKSYRRTKGFTLVEIMIVVVIIGLLAALAIPAFSRVRRESQNRAITNNLRQISYAAHQYFMETGAPSVVLTDLVGDTPDKQIRVLLPAASEDYNTLFPLLYDFTTLTITKSDGTVITYSR